MDFGGGGMSSSGEAAIHGGQVHAFQRQHPGALGGLVDASASINPLGPPATVLAALADLRPLLRHYPDTDHWAVRQVLADTLGVDPDAVWCANGSTEVLDHVFSALSPPRTLVVEPAFAEYARTARRHGSAVHRVAMPPPFELPVAALDERLAAGDLLVLNNPHNPSGRTWRREEWEAPVRRWSTRGVTILLDEAFMDFLPDSDTASGVPLSPRSIPRLIVMRSATKMYSLPGLRFGFGVGPPALVRRIQQQRDPWSVNQVAQVAAAAAYQDGAFVGATRAWLAAERPWMQRALAGLEAHVVPSTANFLLVEWHSAQEADRIREALERQRILIRSLAEWEGLGPRWTRIALQTAPDNERIAAAIGGALRGHRGRLAGPEAAE